MVARTQKQSNPVPNNILAGERKSLAELACSSLHQQAVPSPKNPIGRRYASPMAQRIDSYERLITTILSVASHDL